MRARKGTWTIQSLLLLPHKVDTRDGLKACVYNSSMPSLGLEVFKVPEGLVADKPSHDERGPRSDHSGGMLE